MDVGFGAGGPRQPMLLEDGWEVRQDFWGFRIEKREPWGWLMSSWEGGFVARELQFRSRLRHRAGHRRGELLYIPLHGHTLHTNASCKPTHPWR